MWREEVKRFTGWILAFVLWLLSTIVPVVPLLFILVVIVLAQFSLRVERLPDGKMSIDWGWKDWLGLAMLIVVVFALLTGVDPVKLLRILTGQ